MDKIIHYYYDTDSSQYKRVKPTIGIKLLRATRISILAMGMAVFMVIGYDFYYKESLEVLLKDDFKELEPQHRVETGRRLVEQQETGRAEQSLGKTEPLAACPWSRS